MRKLIDFSCAGETLVGTLDEGAETTGLLIVSGGNEIRIGAHRGMALLAESIARAGYPVLRFDRRGIGDSTGENRGFASSADDVAAAARTFRETGVERIVAYGNCDAATALILHGAAAGVDALLLANPWVIEQPDDLPPPAAIRAHYAARLRDPRQWLRLVSGGVDIGKLVKGLVRSSHNQSQMPESLAGRVALTMQVSPLPTRILLATGDNTAIAFHDAWQRDGFAAIRPRVTVQQHPSDSHSFARLGDKAWLREQVLAALA